jgi:hypothetical protein
MYTRFSKSSAIIKKWTAVSACSLLGLAWSTRAFAEEGTRDCSAVYGAGREAEASGDLHTASEFYQSCGVASCGNPVRHICEAMALRLALDAPSVIPLAKDAAGEPLVEAQVTMDGKLLSARLDGHAVSVEPGLHEFVFSTGSEELGRTRVVIAQGQRNRELWMSVPASEPQQPRASKAQPSLHIAQARSQETSVSATSAASAASAVDHSHFTIAPYLLGGTALLAGGAYALLSSWARKDNEKLTRCSPSCPSESVQHIRNLYLAADISLGVGIAAAVGSVASILLSSSGSDDKPAPQSNRTYAVSVQPQRNGALATFRGSL